MANRNFKRIERVIKSFSRNVEAEGESEGKLVDNVNVKPTTEEQVILPEKGYDGFRKATVEAVVPSEYYKPETSANVTPTTSSQIITPSSGEVFNVVNVEAVDPTQYYKPETSANVVPSIESQTVVPSGNEVFNVINIASVTSSIDSNIQPSNIVSGVAILGVNGTYSVPLQNSKTVTPTTSQQTINPDSGYSALKKVVVKAAPLSYRSVTPSTNGFYVNPSGSYIGFSSIYVQSVNLGYKNINLSAAEYPGQTDEYYASSDGYTGYSYVRVPRVTSSIDSNITPSNIKEGITILGVTGELSGGGVIEVNALPESGDPDSIYRLTENYKINEVSATLPENLFNFIAIRADELKKVYIIGGENHSTGEGSSKIYIYDETSKTLSESPTQLTAPIADACGAYYSNRLFVFGGKTYTNSSWSQSNGNIIEISIDYSTGAITNISSISGSSLYSYCGGCVIPYQNIFYILGGRIYDGYNYNLNNTIYVFEPSMNSFSSTSYHTDYICDFKCIGDTGYDGTHENYYLVGGRHGSTQYVNSLTETDHIYNLQISSGMINWEDYTNVYPEKTLKPEALYGIGAICASGNSGTGDYTLGYVLGGINSVGNKARTICTFDYNYMSMAIDVPYVSGNLPEALSDMQCAGTTIFGGLTASGCSNKIYNFVIEQTQTDYIYRDNQWYNLNELGIIEVEELPQSGRNDRIYDTVATDFETINTNLPKPLAQCACATVGNYIYIIGGMFEDSGMTSENQNIYKYNIQTGNFTTITDGFYPMGVSRPTCAVCNNLIFIFLQNTSNYYILDTTTDTISESYSIMDSLVNAVSKNQYVYIVTSSLVREYQVNEGRLMETGKSIYLETPPMIDTCSAVIKDNYIYIMAIGASSGMGDSEPTKYMYKVNIDDLKSMPSLSDRIAPSQSLPYNLTYASMVAFRDSIYLFGGKTMSEQYPTATATNKILKYNVNSGIFEELTDTMPTAVYSSFGTVTDNKIYVFGGEYADNALMRNVFVDTISTLSTSTLAEYVYRNSSWVEIGGSSGGIQVDTVSNLTANGTVVSWTAPDITGLSQYNPSLEYVITIDNTTTVTTSNTSIDLAQYIQEGTSDVKVQCRLSYTDTKNRTITVTGGASLVEVSLYYFESSGTRLYQENGILGAMVMMGGGESGSTSYPVYTIFGGGDYDTLASKYIVNSSVYRLDQGDIDNMSCSMSLTISDGKVAYYSNLGGRGFIFCGMSIYSWYLRNEGMISMDISLTSMSFSSHAGFQVIAPKFTYPYAVYLFGGIEGQDPSSNIYKFDPFDGSYLSKLSTVTLPEPRAFAEGITLINASGKDIIQNLYILGGFTSIGSGVGQETRASQILKFNIGTESFDMSFNKTLPSNIQVPIAYNVDGRMNTHTVNVQGTQYVLGKDTTDNKVKLFVFDEEEENLKSSGIELTNQNIKLIDTMETLGGIVPYGIGLYQDQSGYLHQEKIIISKMQKTLIQDDIFSGLSPYPENGLTFIKDNHMYILSRSSNFDINLSTKAVTTFSISGLLEVEYGTMLVENAGDIYLIGGMSSRSIKRLNISDKSSMNLGYICESSKGSLHNGVALSYNGKIYVFGGATGTSSSFGYSSDIYRFDPSTDTQGTKLSASLSEARFGTIGIVVGHYAYIIGGQYISSSYAYPSKKIEKFDFESETIVSTYYCQTLELWTTTSDRMEWNLCNNPVFYIEDKIYVKVQEYEPQLLEFDKTLENFADYSSETAEFTAKTEIAKKSILFEEAIWSDISPVCYNSEIYAFEFYKDNSGGILEEKYKFIKYSK